MGIDWLLFVYMTAVGTERVCLGVLFLLGSVSSMW